MHRNEASLTTVGCVQAIAALDYNAVIAVSHRLSQIGGLANSTGISRCPAPSIRVIVRFIHRIGTYHKPRLKQGHENPQKV